MAERTIERLESTNPPHPKRYTAIDLAYALGLDVDESLALLGYEPLSEAERNVLTPPVDPGKELDRLRASLTRQQIRALVYVAATMVNPRQWPEIDRLARPVASSDPVTAVEHSNVVIDLVPQDEAPQESTGSEPDTDTDTQTGPTT